MSDTYLEKAEKILNDVVDSFLKKVKTLCDNNSFEKLAAKYNSCFQILGLSNNIFYKYSQYENRLEALIREDLINASLSNLFTIHEINAVVLNDLNCSIFSTEAKEDKLCFEFIVSFNGKRIGYRYTLVVDNIEELKCKYNVDEVVRINWQNKKHPHNLNGYSYIDVEELFDQYFSKEEYNIFIVKLCEAVKEATKELGFETISVLSLKSLSNLKDEIKNELISTNYAEMRYSPLKKDDINLSLLILSESDCEILNKNFKTKGYFQALVGSEEFAKCFITSEYQYRIFKEDNYFDYTAVVCGYLKFIEQLVYKLVKINLKSNLTDEKLMIKCRIKKNKRKKLINDKIVTEDGNKIIFSEEYEQYFDTTLTPLVNFLYENNSGWHISNTGIETIYKLLINFASECRNDHFHKDNISDYEVVKKIRNNTIILAYLLLGGYKLTESDTNNKKMLGIIDDSFDRIYKKIRSLPYSVNKFLIEFPNKPVVKAYKNFNQEITAYDSTGLVNLSKISFFEVDCFSDEELNNVIQGKKFDSEFFVSANNLPTRIWYYIGDKKTIIDL